MIERDYRSQRGLQLQRSGVFLQDITHPSTDRTQCCLTSVTGQDRRSQRGIAGHNIQ
jgi:hypothetical protein